MSKGINNFVILTAGVVIGTLTASRYFKEKYEKISKEEIESVKEVYKKKEEQFKTVSKEVAIVKSVDKDTKVNDYNDIVSKYNKGENAMRDEIGPYVISPKEFDEEGYETISLTYYADGVLADEQNFPIEDIEDTVGNDALNSFGEYEDDSVFVRDDDKGIDYEILLDNRKYSELPRTEKSPNVEE